MTKLSSVLQHFLELKEQQVATELFQAIAAVYEERLSPSSYRGHGANYHDDARRKARLWFLYTGSSFGLLARNFCSPSLGNCGV